MINPAGVDSATMLRYVVAVTSWCHSRVARKTDCSENDLRRTLRVRCSDCGGLSSTEREIVLLLLLLFLLHPGMFLLRIRSSRH
ncbi:hypothetical protein X777_10130 [Ooceraea biroi]|uniref:Uncharacterized protein n=1 Tax=Ooceraea biroi TaxID=2015173 RepID=A0A026X2G4_OOCBI|nr:hypothetical protein X777_10130 [Ooceraea biroi]